MKKVSYFILSTFLILLAFACQVEKRISYNEVVNRMTDLQRLSKLPAEGEKSGMFSSYDRRSKYDEDANEYIHWAANDDGLTPQYIRKEGEDMVLVEMEGPGAIVRVWSASPARGHIKVYIDGNEEPAIDLPFIDYFKTSSLPVFDYPNLVYETNARGFNNYVPITFQKSVKIIGEPGWGQYYQFNYITFPKETVVEDFSTAPSSETEKALQRVNDILGSEMGKPVADETNADLETTKLTINPGELKNAFKIEGKRAITSLKIKMGPLVSGQEAEAYRKTILTMNWDGNPEPAVWSPIGDFFGSAPGFNKYKTLPMGMTDDGMYSYWYMPFGKMAELSIENTADFPVELELEVTHEKLKGNPADFGRFHAKWHRDIMPVEESRWPDWTVLKTQGKGRFVGMFLSVWNPKGGSCREFGGEGQHWWGEGDEKFHVDGEKFPSTFGTGTEDYFGYAWCIPNLFEHAYHSQNYTEQNMGYQSLNRWQIIDNVPFQESFEAYMEKYFPNHWPTQYATVAYWYLDKDGIDPIEPTPANELFGYETAYEVFRVQDVVEAESMKIVSNTGGWVTTDAFSHEKLYNEVSGHQVMFWFSKKDGDNVLEASFDFNQSGTYEVYANILLSRQGGKFDVAVNDKKVSSGLVFFSDEELPVAKYVRLGTVTMKEGKQKLSFKGIEDSSVGNRMALDYLKFEPIK